MIRRFRERMQMVTWKKTAFAQSTQSDIREAYQADSVEPHKDLDLLH